MEEFNNQKLLGEGKKMTKGTYVKINEMLDTIYDMVSCMLDYAEEENISSAVQLKADLKDAVEVVNRLLLDSPEVCFYRCSDLNGDKGTLIEQYFSWLGGAREVLEKQYHADNIWDERFIRLMDRIQYVEFDVIVESVKKSLFEYGTEIMNRLCRYYHMFSEMWGTLDIENDQYDVIINRVTELKEHREDFIWLYKQLGDQRSKLVLVSILYSWVTFDPFYIHIMKEANYTDYFDLDLVKCDENEVMVDLGAWTGDSTLNYIQTYGKYKKIYCYEIDESSMEEMKKNLSEYSDIEFRNKGVGNKNGMKCMEGEPNSTCNKLTEIKSGKEVELVRLDDDINERITLIKTDIEGAEQEALQGASRHIREEKPKLLISVYHNNEDIWKIPRMIRSMNPNYQLYLRSNGEQWRPAEIVLLAIDKADR